MKACSIAPLTKEFLIKLLSQKNPLKKFENKSNELKEVAAMARRRRQVTFGRPLAAKKRGRARRVRTPKKTITSFFAPKKRRRRPLRLPGGRNNIRKRVSRRRGRRRVAPILPARSRRRRRRKVTSRMAPALRRRSHGRRRTRATPKRRHRPRSSGNSRSTIKPGRALASEPKSDSEFVPGKTTFKSIVKSNSAGPQSLFAT